MGIKGLETEGWEIVPRRKSPKEIIDEYEQLEKERQERRLNQRTNPKGTTTMSVDATDIFDRYTPHDAEDYGSYFPQFEISSMSISQSIDLPLTAKDTASLGGNIQSQNGTGTGTLTGSFRRVTSSNGWGEVECTVGNETAITMRGYRTIWNFGYGTMTGSLQLMPRSIRPSLSTTIAHQIKKNLQGRITWNAMSPSSMQTVIAWDSQPHSVMFGCQLGWRASFLMFNYSYRQVEHDFRAKAAFRVGTFGAVVEYGCEKKVSQFSVLGASISIGSLSGVILKIKIMRGNQNFMFPFQLSDNFVPSAVFYGTVLPIGFYFIIKKLIVDPFLLNQKNKELQEKKSANSERIEKKKKDAETAVELMQDAVDRIYQSEKRKKGLVIKKAFYGKIEEENENNLQCISVEKQLQFLIKDSRLLILADTEVSELPGFYDPCIGEDKELIVFYEFHKKPHYCKYKEKDKILLPNREHIVKATNPNSRSTRPSSESPIFCNSVSSLDDDDD